MFAVQEEFPPHLHCNCRPETTSLSCTHLPLKGRRVYLNWCKRGLSVDYVGIWACTILNYTQRRQIREYISQSARCGDDHIPAHVHASKTGWINSELIIRLTPHYISHFQVSRESDEHHELFCTIVLTAGYLARKILEGRYCRDCSTFGSIDLKLFVED